jgi:hypothetical protein
MRWPTSLAIAGGNIKSFHHFVIYLTLVAGEGTDFLMMKSNQKLVLYPWYMARHNPPAMEDQLSSVGRNQSVDG